MKNTYKTRINELESVLNVLYQKETILNNKIIMLSNFNSNHKAKLKKLSEEIINLQKNFLEIISNKNNA